MSAGEMMTAADVARASDCHPATARRRMNAAGAVLQGGRLVVEREAMNRYAADRVARVLAGWGFDPGDVASLIARAPGGRPRRGEVRDVVLNAVGQGATLDHVVRESRVRRATAIRVLGELEADGVVEVTGRGTRGMPRRWSLQRGA